MKKKICFIVIALVCLAAALLIGFGVNLAGILNTEVERGVNCTGSSDCDWVITNCCQMTAGGVWECVNLKSYKQPECNENVICPQMFSPEPATACTCKEGVCVIV